MSNYIEWWLSAEHPVVRGRILPGGRRASVYRDGAWRECNSCCGSPCRFHRDALAVVGAVEGCDGGEMMPLEQRDVLEGVAEMVAEGRLLHAFEALKSARNLSTKPAMWLRYEQRLQEIGAMIGIGQALEMAQPKTVAESEIAAEPVAECAPEAPDGPEGPEVAVKTEDCCCC